MRMPTHQSRLHHHGPVHLDETDWEALAAHTEHEGELLLAFWLLPGGWIQPASQLATWRSTR